MPAMIPMTEGFSDLSFTEYRAQNWAVSQSDLNLLLKAPILYEHIALKGNRRQSTKAQSEGSAIHCAVLEPERFIEDFIPLISDGRKTSAAYKTALKDMMAMVPHATILDADDFDRFREIAGVIHRHEKAVKLLTDCEFENSFFWKQEKFNIWSKGRSDALNLSGGYVVDLKTTKDAAGFSRSVEDYGYHRQAAYYLQGISKLSGREFKDWYWIAVETHAPYLCAVYKASANMLEMGAIENEVLLSKLQTCIETKSFPGLTTDVTELDLSQWYFSRTKDRFTSEIDSDNQEAKVNG